MPDEDAIAILKIACRALSDLLDDKEYTADLANAISLARAVQQNKDPALPEFGGFIHEFVLAERNVLMQAGVDMDSTAEILQEISDLAKDAVGRHNRLARIGDQIAYCKKLACEGHDNIDVMNKPRPLWADIRLAVRGIAVVSINSAMIGGAAAIFLPVSAAVAGGIAGVSVGYGCDAIIKSIRGRW